MRDQSQRHSHWHSLPFVSFIISEWQLWHAEQTRPCYTLAHTPPDDSELPVYPMDLWPLLTLPKGPLDEAGVLYYVKSTSEVPSGYYATAIAQYALARWNAFLYTGEAQHRESFLIQAEWLVAHETRLSNTMGGWPFVVSLPDYHASAPWLSGLIQGNAISVLVRAFRLTGKDVFLQVARRAARTFELDIRNGGVSTTIGDDGIFFEEVAAYPAAHILNGFIFAFFGLFDYVALTGDEQIAALTQRSHATLHSMIDQYDTGYWTRYDLLHRYLASRFYHDQHSVLLQALSSYSACQNCLVFAKRWKRYESSLLCCLQYVIVSRFVRYWRAMRRGGIRRACSRILKSQGHSIATHEPLLKTTSSVAPLSSGEERHS